MRSIFLYYSVYDIFRAYTFSYKKTMEIIEKGGFGHQSGF